ALAVVLRSRWLPAADPLPECGMRNAECGVAEHRSIPLARPSARRLADTFRTPRSAFCVGSSTLTIGRLHYDGGGDWYAGPSALPNLLAALRQRTALSVTERERVVTLTGPELWDVPYLFMTRHANVRSCADTVKQLQR